MPLPGRMDAHPQGLDNDQCDGATRLILYVEFGTQIVFVL
jgi:hypothetical protein